MLCDDIYVFSLPHRMDKTAKRRPKINIDSDDQRTSCHRMSSDTQNLGVQEEWLLELIEKKIFFQEVKKVWFIEFKHGKLRLPWEFRGESFRHFWLFYVRFNVLWRYRVTEETLDGGWWSFSADYSGVLSNLCSRLDRKCPGGIRCGLQSKHEVYHCFLYDKSCCCRHSLSNCVRSL